MHTRTRYLACGFLIAAGFTTAAAQISVDTNDVKKMFAVGTSVVYRLDSTAVTANIGAPGASSWDFSGLKTTSTMKLVSVALATTPYYPSQFPAATHVLKYDSLNLSLTLTGLGKVILIGTGYDYLQLSGDFFDFGLIGDGKAFLGVVSGTGYNAHGQWLDSLPAVYYGLPLEYGNSWSTGFTQVLSGHADLGGLGNLNFGPIPTAHYIVYSIDAYGQLTLPGGYTEDALRIRKEDRATSGTTNTYQIGYIFMTKSGASVQFTQADTTSPSSGTVPARAMQWNESLVTTSVAHTPQAPETFALYPNYPNPFNPSTTITYSLDRKGEVSLKVFNLLGQEVATLVNGTFGPGARAVQFNATNLSSGIYFYRLQANGQVLTRTMVLTK